MSIQHVGRGGEEENTQTQNSLSSPLACDIIFFIRTMPRPSSQPICHAHPPSDMPVKKNKK